MEELSLENYFKKNTFLNNKTVTVALSGGADSVCLLYLINEVKDKFNINLKAAHLNHLIRDEEAFRDQHFCEELCKKMGVELTVKKADVPKLKQKGESLELAARRIRYEFFKALKTDYIATAHNKDDNAETVILNILRGCGLKGLTGIPEIRENYIRPLLYFKKCDILSFCKKNNLSFVTDSTNLSNDYSRNKIRNMVFPVFESINEKFTDNIARLSDLALLENSFLDEYTLNVLNASYGKKGIITSFILKENEAVINRAVKKYLEENLKFSIDEKTLKNIVLKIKNGKDFKINIINNKYVYFTNNELYLKKEEPEIEFFVSTQKVNKFSKQNTIDCDKIIGKLKLDVKKAGDTIKLKKRPEKTLKKLFTEKKIPQNMRKNLPVLRDDNGIVWVYKIGVAERAVPNENSKNLAEIAVEEKYVNS